MRMRIYLAIFLALFTQNLLAESSEVQSLIEDATAAAANFNQQEVMTINGIITDLRSDEPAWVDEAMQAATMADDEAVAAWAEMAAEAEAALMQGDLEGGLGAQEAALQFAEEVFGGESWYTISTLRDLGYIYRQAGMAEDADGYYSAAFAAAQEVLGDTHPETLQIASLMAELYSAAGMSDDAVMMREMIVAALEAGMGPVHTYTVSARLTAANALAEAGQYEAAIDSLVDTCGDIERGFGLYHDQSVTCLELLADLQFQAGLLDEAEKTYLQVTSILGRSTTTVSERVLHNMSQLAEVYRVQGRYQESKDLLSSVIQLALQTGQVGVSYTAKSYLGRVLTNEASYDPAQVVTEEVLDFGLANWQEQPLNIYNTLLDLGGIYQAQGKLADAEATFEETLAGLNELVGDMHPSTLVASNNLGQVYESIGLYDEAEPILKDTLERMEALYGPAHPDTLRSRNNLAVLHESQGNFREAEPLYLESLDLMLQVYGEYHTDTVAVQNNLAYLYMLMEDFEASAAMFEEVHEKWRTIFSEDHQNTLKARNNLARVYRRMGRLDEAEPLFLSAYEARARMLGEDHLDTIRSMIDLGGLYLDQGRLEEANDLVTDALERAERVLTEQHPYTFDALNMMARIKTAMGQTQAALDLRETGLQRRSQFLDRMLWSTGENAREGYIRLHRPEFNEYMSLLAQVRGEDAGRRAIEASLQRKGLLLKVTSEIQQIAGLRLDPELSRIASELEQARKDLASLTLSGPTAETGERHAEVLYELEQRVNELQGELGRASVRFRTSIAQMSTSTLEGVLRDNSALVDFLLYEEGDDQKILAGVLVKEDGELRYEFINYPNRKEVEDAIIEYRTYIQDDLADEDEVLEIGMLAHDIVWGPITEVLDGIDYVYVIPDGVLNILPFNALVDGDETYLIQTHDLHILTSARDLLPSQFQLAQGEYIIMAGPDYDSDEIVSEAEIAAAAERRSSALQLGIRGAGGGLRGLSFAPLPGAEKEGQIITEVVEENNEPRQVFFREDAQEQVLADLERPPEILHVATHGFFLEADEQLRKRLLKLQRGAEIHVPPPGDNPLLRSGLAFAGINSNAQFLGDIDTANDGVLTAIEVLDLDLSGTQLVVLSACETGLGEIHEGEGVYGLRRSFQEAGVAEVISSLWEVSDAGTQALMTAFYDRLLEGEPAREALRGAQLELMESPQWGYPYIWSAFMIVGSYESAGFTVQ